MINPLPQSSKVDPPRLEENEPVRSYQRSAGRFNLKIKLPLVSIGLLALAFLVLTILSVSISRTTLTNTLKNNLLQEAALQTEGIRSYLIWTRNMAIDMSSVAGTMTMDEETSKSVIRQMLSNNEQVVGSTIAYEPYRFALSQRYWAPYYSRGTDGTLRFSQLGTDEYDYPRQDWYKLAKDADGIILSPPYFDAGGGEIWMVTWSVPFHDEAGKIKGVATADIAFSQTQELVRQIEVGKAGYAFLVDPNGVILGVGDQGGEYRIMEESLFVSNPSRDMAAWNKMVQDMVDGKSGFVGLTDPQGRAMFVAYDTVGLGTGWSLGLAYPQEELFLPAVRLQNTLILLSMGILVFASLILFLFSRSITNPLERITAWAGAVSEGKAGLMGSVAQAVQIRTNDEIEDLAQAFSLMSTRLARSFDTLEQQVADRTRALAASSEVSRRLSTILDQRQLVSEVVEQIRTAFNYYHAHIYLYDEFDQELVMAGGTGEAGQTMLARGHKIPRGRGLVGRAAESGQAVLVGDTSQDPDWLQNPLLPETRCEVAVPIVLGGRVLGVLDVQHHTVNGMKEADVDLLQSIANQVAIALHNARSYEEASQRAEREALISSIGRKIESASSVEAALQVAARELGRAMGVREMRVVLDPSTLASKKIS